MNLIANREFNPQESHESKPESVSPPLGVVCVQGAKPHRDLETFAFCVSVN